MTLFSTKRCALEREARQLIRQWLKVRRTNKTPSDRIVQLNRWHKQKAWVAPFDMGSDVALILNNGAIAARGTLRFKQDNGEVVEKHRVWVIYRTYSDSLDNERLSRIVSHLRADLTFQV